MATRPGAPLSLIPSQLFVVPEETGSDSWRPLAGAPRHLSEAIILFSDEPADP